MTEIKEKFSRLGYQQELISKLTDNTSMPVKEDAYLFVQDKKGKVLALQKTDVDFIDDIKFVTFLPPFKDEVLAVVNILEKEVLLIDLDSFLYKEPSLYRDATIPKEYKCLLLKGRKVGLLAKILTGYIYKKSAHIEVLGLAGVYKLLD